jgi:acetyltransferase-like isoleucine patch superfamily enzyme
MTADNSVITAERIGTEDVRADVVAQGNPLTVLKQQD